MAGNPYYRTISETLDLNGRPISAVRSSAGTGVSLVTNSGTVKRLAEGSNVTLTDNGSSIEISSSGGGGATTFAALTDVDVTPVQPNQSIHYDAVAARWTQTPELAVDQSSRNVVLNTTGAVDLTAQQPISLTSDLAVAIQSTTDNVDLTAAVGDVNIVANDPASGVFSVNSRSTNVTSNNVSITGNAAATLSSLTGNATVGSTFGLGRVTGGGGVLMSTTGGDADIVAEAGQVHLDGDTVLVQSTGNTDLTGGGVTTVSADVVNLSATNNFRLASTGLNNNIIDLNASATGSILAFGTVSAENYANRINGLDNTVPNLLAVRRTGYGALGATLRENETICTYAYDATSATPAAGKWVMLESGTPITTYTSSETALTMRFSTTDFNGSVASLVTYFAVASTFFDRRDNFFTASALKNDGLGVGLLLSADVKADAGAAAGDANVPNVETVNQPTYLEIRAVAPATNVGVSIVQADAGSPPFTIPNGKVFDFRLGFPPTTVAGFPVVSSALTTPADGDILQYDSVAAQWRIINRITNDLVNLNLTTAAPAFSFTASGVQNFHVAGKRIKVRVFADVLAGRAVAFGGTAGSAFATVRPPRYGNPDGEINSHSNIVGVTMTDALAGGEVEIATSGLVGMIQGTLGVQTSIRTMQSPGAIVVHGTKFDDAAETGYGACDINNPAPVNSQKIGSSAWPFTGTTVDVSTPQTIFVWLNAGSEAA